MPFATWWRGDSLPDLSPLPHFSVQRSTDIQLITQLTDLSKQELDRRFQRGNHIYIACVSGEPAAYGWAAMQEGGIIELQFFFPVTSGDCYLWDFKTLPQWRGKSIYPQLLQAIIKQEHAIQHFWIVFMSSNAASSRGIQKAGFHIVSELFVFGDRVTGLTLLDNSQYALASSEFFRLPIVAKKSEA